MIVYIHTLSPLHVGIGHSPSAIDLPIARDKASGFPIVPGSGLKGALRSAAREREHEVVKVFGPNTDNASDHAGGLHFGDAQLVALPVRSVAGTFAWVTSPYLLMRLARDLKAAGFSKAPAIPKVGNKGQALVPNGESALKADEKGGKAQVFLEDLDFVAGPDDHAGAWARHIAKGALAEGWEDFFVQRFLVVHDGIMRYLSVHGIDVTTRNRLENDTKTVAKGALWSEENLPTETILASFAFISPNSKTLDREGLQDAVNKFNGETVFLGGNSGIGRGRCELRVVSAAEGQR